MLNHDRHRHPALRLSLWGTIVIALGLFGCSEEPQMQDENKGIRPVKFITVTGSTDTSVDRFPAVIGANRLSELSLQVSGKLQEFPVKKAQRLNEGDLIAKLDQRDFESAVLSAKAQFENAEKEYNRAVRLAEQDAIARNVLDQRKAQLDVSKAQFEQAEKALSDSVLTAPFKGVIAATLIEELETVSAGQVLVTYMSAETLEATVDVPANYLARLPKLPEDGSPPPDDRHAFVILDSAPEKPIPAAYEEATLLADSASQTYAVSLLFSPPEDMLVLPGMNATVELHRKNAPSEIGIAVPLDAITTDGSQNYVWTVDKNTMAVSKRAVTVEEGVGKEVTVTEGLNLNDTIVGAGAAYLSEGMVVREWKTK